MLMFLSAFVMLVSLETNVKQMLTSVSSVLASTMELAKTKPTHLSVIAYMTYEVSCANKVQSLSMPLNTCFRKTRQKPHVFFRSIHSFVSNTSKELKKKKLSICNNNMKTKHSLNLFKIVEKIGHHLQTGQERIHQLSTQVLMF